jgi:hypothetical protein
MSENIVARTTALEQLQLLTDQALTIQEGPTYACPICGTVVDHSTTYRQWMHPAAAWKPMDDYADNIVYLHYACSCGAGARWVRLNAAGDQPETSTIIGPVTVDHSDMFTEVRDIAAALRELKSRIPEEEAA